MPEPVNAQLTKLETLEKEIGKYIATAQGTEGKPDSFKTGTATQSKTLDTVSALLKITYGISDVKTIGEDISNAFEKAATALQQVGDTLESVTTPDGVDPSYVIQQLQAAILVAQTVVPGNNSALASGSQFFSQISDLLKDVGNDIGKARTILYKIAQQFKAIAKALKPA